MALEYITNRNVENKQGEAKGNIKIMKLKENEKAMIELSCPECGKTEKREEAWEEPFMSGDKKNRKFTIKCSGCSFATKVINLKKQAQKDMKKKK